MKPADEERIAARLATLMATLCVRNTGIEDLHAGTVPVTHTGDYSDVFSTDADGRQIPWIDASHLDRWVAIAERWEEPQLNEIFVEFVGRPRS